MAKLHRTPAGPRFLASSVTIGMALLARPAEGQVTERVSVDSTGVQGNNTSLRPALSADGMVVAFWSDASNLVAGDTNGALDIFIHDRNSGSTERVPASWVALPFLIFEFTLSLSADGNLLCFSTDVALSPADTNGVYDFYIYHRSPAGFELVSVDSAGAVGNGPSYAGSISADSRIVAFPSFATNLVVGDTNGHGDVFVHDRTMGVTERVSVDSSGTEGGSTSYIFAGSLSADGGIVCFDSGASNLVAGDTNWRNDVFVHDRVTGITERVNVDSSGVESNDVSFNGGISADGQVVVFVSFSSNLVAGDTNNLLDAFVHDRSTGVTERVSVTSAGREAALGTDYESSISADGRLVEFVSFDTSLVPGDSNLSGDIFLHDRETGITSRVSVASSGKQGNDDSFDGRISSDGLNVVFGSVATNLVPGDTNLSSDAFVHELCSIDATWVNYGAGFPGTLGVPIFTSQADPKLGTTITLDVGNSLGAPTTGWLFAGTSRASIPFKQGTLLVGNSFLIEPFPIAAGGTTFDAEIPNDASLGGLLFDAQVLELDAGAAKGVSFSAGLELLLGR